MLGQNIPGSEDYVWALVPKMYWQTLTAVATPLVDYQPPFATHDTFTKPYHNWVSFQCGRTHDAPIHLGNHKLLCGSDNRRLTTFSENRYLSVYNPVVSSSSFWVERRRISFSQCYRLEGNAMIGEWRPRKTGHSRPEDFDL